jgi:very-short-patch-repair endonuclease
VRVTRSRHEVVPATAHGQPVVPLARTMVDLAQHLDEQEIAGCLYDVIRRQQVSAAEVAAEVEGLRTGVAGLGRLRRVLDSFDPAYDSMVEAVAAAELRAAGIHLTPQVEVWDGPFLVARIDLADEELKFGLEIDGFAYHGTRVAQRRDRSRDRTLHALGWTISRVDALDVLERMPVVVADVARVRARLAAERRRAS